MEIREEFEQWAYSRGFDMTRYGESYERLSTAAGWGAWQACAARMVPDNAVVVPIEAIRWLCGLGGDGFAWPDMDRKRFGFRSEFIRRAGLNADEIFAAAPEPKK